MNSGNKPQLPTVHITEVSVEDGELYESVVSSPVCDFCADKNPAWDYDCEQFSIDEICFGSAGKWAACHSCSQLIEAGEDQILAERALDCPWVQSKDFWRPRVWMIHNGFREHRIGDRIAWG